jgi:hypothetical protein
MTYEQKRIWKKAVVAYSKYYPDNFLEGVRKTAKNLSQSSR